MNPSTRPRPRLGSLLGAALLGVALLSAPSARAEQDPQRAKQLYLQARELLEAGQIRESLEKLQQAYDAYPSDAILISIANRHLDLGEPEEASAVLSRIQPDSSKLRKQVDRLRKDVEVRLAEPVTVSISSDTPTATVAIDGGAWRELPTRVQLPRGQHRFVVKAAGHEQVALTKDLRGSQVVPIIVSLPVAMGRWRVVLEPERELTLLQLKIDGRLVPLTADERLARATALREVRPGAYVVDCLEEERSKRVRMTVGAGEEVVVRCAVPAKTERRKPTAWAWASAGGAVAALAGGTYYLVSYLGEKNDYPEPRYDVSSTKPVASGVLYGTGVGLGVLSAFLFAK